MDTVLGCILRLFFIHLPPLVLGLLLFLIGVLVRETQPPGKPEKLRGAKGPASSRWQSFERFLRRGSLPAKWKMGFIIAGLAILALVVAWFLIRLAVQPDMVDRCATGQPPPPVPSSTPTATPSVTLPTTPTPTAPSPFGIALVNLKFMPGGWDPHQIDIRSAAQEGIWVNVGYSLRLYDLWVSVPEGVTGYRGQFEIYAKGEVIGRTHLLDLQPGGTLFEDVVPTSYQHPDVVNAWVMQQDWDALDIDLILFRGKQPAGGAVTTLRLNNTGTAWYNDPPYVSLASLVYHLNDGPRMVLDLRTAQDPGIDATSGDQLTIDEIWVKSSSSVKERSMQVEIYLSSGEYDASAAFQTPWTTFAYGVREIPLGKSFVWESISAEKKLLIVTVSRNDKTVLDRYVIPLGSSQRGGLVTGANVFNWPLDIAQYTDFESESDLGNWAGKDFSQIAWSSQRAFTGSHSLSVTVTGNPEKGVLVERSGEFQAEVLVGQVYWPEQKGIEITWAQVCVPSVCRSIPIKTDQWNTFVMDFSEISLDEIPLNEKKIDLLYLQAGIDGASPENPYTFFVDGIQLYPVQP
jgi:hypothetical protein